MEWVKGQPMKLITFCLFHNVFKECFISLTVRAIQTMTVPHHCQTESYLNDLFILTARLTEYTGTWTTEMLSRKLSTGSDSRTTFLTLGIFGIIDERVFYLKTVLWIFGFDQSHNFNRSGFHL